jgi:hypothetical protein
MELTCKSICEKHRWPSAACRNASPRMTLTTLNLRCQSKRRLTKAEAAQYCRRLTRNALCPVTPTKIWHFLKIPISAPKADRRIKNGPLRTDYIAAIHRAETLMQAFILRSQRHHQPPTRCRNQPACRDLFSARRLHPRAGIATGRLTGSNLRDAIRRDIAIAYFVIRRTTKRRR